MAERVLCLIPGISPDHLQHRISILKNNIEKLSVSQFETEFHVYNYANLKLDIPFVDRVISGRLGLFQVFQKYDCWVDCYDYVIVLLDDVEILDIDMENMIRQYKKNNMAIMSPTVSLDSVWAHEVMKIDHRPLIREVKFIELFCYVMTPNIYHLWASIMTMENTFGWGIDTNMKLLLDLKLFLFDEYKIKHHYINTVDSRRPLHQVCVSQMREYNKLMGKRHRKLMADFPDYTVIRELPYI